MERIPFHEIKFHPHSYGDPAGRLFQWKGQLYRGISSEWTPFFRQLVQEGVIQRLVSRGLLIETELTPFAMDEYEMVLRHRSVPFVSYPEEWCAAMLKEAAVTIVEFLEELAPYGLTLKDAHPWNLLFDSCKPVFVDLTSISSIKENPRWSGYDSFCRFNLYPLMLMSQGQERIARRLLPEYEGVQESDVLLLKRGASLPASISSRIASFLRRGFALRQSLMRKPVSNLRSYRAFLGRMRREVERITLPDSEIGSSNHKANLASVLSPQKTWTATQRRVHQIITELRPGSVLDLGYNGGWYSYLAAHLGSCVVSFEPDSKEAARLYYCVRDQKLPILPLVMDFKDPTPPRGLSSHWAIAATERFQCDLVLALSVTHNVAFGKLLNFDHFADGLALFAKRSAVLDFVPPGKQDIPHQATGWFSWYNLDNLVNTLGKRFRSVRILSPHSEPCALLLCEK